jgi:hypothetical protein
MRLEKKQRAIYQHAIWRVDGVYMYLAYSDSNEPQNGYNELLAVRKQAMAELSQRLQQATPDERRVIFTEPLPEPMRWHFSIAPIGLPQDYSNNGSRRRANLKRRLSQKAPLFAEELYERETEQRQDYFSGKADVDQRRAESTSSLQDEYWEAVLLSDAGWMASAV